MTYPSDADASQATPSSMSIASDSTRTSIPAEDTAFEPSQNPLRSSVESSISATNESSAFCISCSAPILTTIRKKPNLEVKFYSRGIPVNESDGKDATDAIEDYVCKRRRISDVFQDGTVVIAKDLLKVSGMEYTYDNITYRILNLLHFRKLPPFGSIYDIVRKQVFRGNLGSSSLITSSAIPSEVLAEDNLGEEMDSEAIKSLEIRGKVRSYVETVLKGKEASSVLPKEILYFSLPSIMDYMIFELSFAKKYINVDSGMTLEMLTEMRLHEVDVPNLVQPFNFYILRKDTKLIKVPAEMPAEQDNLGEEMDSESIESLEIRGKVRSYAETVLKGKKASSVLPNELLYFSLPSIADYMIFELSFAEKYINVDSGITMENLEMMSLHKVSVSNLVRSYCFYVLRKDTKLIKVPAEMPAEQDNLGEEMDYESIESLEIYKEVQIYVEAVLKGKKASSVLPNELLYFSLPSIADYMIFELSFAQQHINKNSGMTLENLKMMSLHMVSVSNLVHLFNFYVLRKDTKLIKVPEELPVESLEDKKSLAAKEAIIKSFSREFLGKPATICSFLTYLSRHYGKEKFNMNQFFNYYSPTASIHQSSGSGKSRLCDEISPFLLPLVISGPNSTGKPEESALLSEFSFFLQTIRIGAYYHISVILSVINAFQTQVMFYAIRNKLSSLGVDVEKLDSDENYKIDDGVWIKFFACDIPADLARENVSIEVFKDFLANTETKTEVGDISQFPKCSKFAVVGVDVVDKLKKLFNLIRKARIRFLVNQLDFSEDEVTNLLEWLPHSLYIFDEAQHLSTKLGGFNPMRVTIDRSDSTVEIDGFRCFRRTSRNSDFYWEYAWSVLISTNGSMSNFTPTWKEDPSMRLVQNTLLVPPFIFQESMDVLAVDFESKALSAGAYEMHGLDYVYGWSRLCHILSCGRPLFYSFVEGGCKEQLERAYQENHDISQWNYDLRNSFTSLYDMIIGKLMGGVSSKKLAKKLNLAKEETLVYALLASAVGLYSLPLHAANVEDLVRNRMAWVTYYNTDSQDVGIYYPSEGMFSCVMGYLCQLKFTEYLDEVLKQSFHALTFFVKPATKKQFSSWQITEICSRMLFLFAMYRTDPFSKPGADESAVLEKMVIIDDSYEQELKRIIEMIAPRSIEVLLQIFATYDAKSKTLNTDDCNEISNYIDQLGYKDAVTAFGYFQEASIATKPLQFCKTMLFRGSAKYLPANHPGADFILPMVLKDGRYGLVLVQVKGIKEDILIDVGKSRRPVSGKEPILRKRKRESNNSLAHSPTASVRKYMELCTIPGVFKMLERKNMSKVTKAESKRLRNEHADFPVMRVLINLNSNNSAGVKHFSDDYGSFLAIQTSGDLSFVSESEKSFIKLCIQTADNAPEGKLPNLEQSMMDDKSEGISYETENPFNPSYMGILQDNDTDIFSGDFFDATPSQFDPPDKPEDSVDSENPTNSKNTVELPKNPEVTKTTKSRRPKYYFPSAATFYKKINKH